MSDPKDWSVEGVDPDIRNAARRAAEEDGVGVGDWVEAAIRRQAAAGTGGADGTHPVIGMLEALEARLAEQDSRLMGALQPLAESLDALDGRLRSLEAAAEPWPGEAPPPAPDHDMPDPDMPDADILDAGEALGADAVGDASPPPSARRVRIGAGERLEPLFGKAAPGDDELREADAAVEGDLNTLFDDGAHAGPDGRPATRRAIYDEAGVPRAARSTRGTVVLLGIVAVLILIAAGIVAFVWNEVTRPPVPPVPEDGSSLADTAASPPSAEPPAASLPSVPDRGEDGLAPGEGRAELATPAIGDIEAQDGADAGAGGDESDALAGIRAAAEAGDPRAQNELAVRYLVGQDVPQDYVRAAEWLERAAAAGVTSAQYNLGVLYDSGRGVAADPVEALIWFHAAAEKGHGRAQYALASAYAAGRGIERNPDGAMRWLERAADANVTEAQMSLASILSSGQTTREELVEALYWYRIADANGAAGASEEADRIASVLVPEERAGVSRRVSEHLSRRLARPAPGTGAGGAAPQTPPPPSPAAESPAAESPAAEASAPENPPVPAPPAAGAPPTDAPDPGTVRQVQSLLAALGFRPGPADGAMGARTRAAIVEYQREFGMAETGEATPELLRHLREVSGIAE